LKNVLNPVPDDGSGRDLKNKMYMKRTWSDKDLEILKQSYPEHGSVYCAKLLKKTHNSVKSKASVLNIKRTNFRMNPAHGEYIRKNSHLNNKELAEILGIKEHSVRYYIHRHHIRTQTWKHFSNKEIEFIKANFRKLSYKEIGRELGRTHWSIKNKCKYLKLKRTPREARIIHKQCCSASYFTKGHEPTNTKYNGYISTRTDNKGNNYKHIRVSKGKFKHLQIVNWENKIGPIPEGKILRCKTTDTLNCNPDNWYLIDRIAHLEENAGRKELTDKYIINNLSRSMPEIKESIQEMPELIELKRNQLKIRRQLNERTG